MSTLPWRMRAHCANAHAVAEFLQRHPAVERVHYPGLPDHRGHEIAGRQMSGWGGMLSFQVRGGRKAAMAVAGRVHLFIRATSLGGAHSLIEHRASIEGPGTKTPQNLLRASIGLENSDDLIADLQQALPYEVDSVVPASGGSDRELEHQSATLLARSLGTYASSGEAPAGRTLSVP